MNWTSFNRLIKLGRALYNLPFTALGATLPFALGSGTPTVPITLMLCVWIAVAFLTARSSGMAFNELIDRHIDSANPRTRERVLPSGLVSPAAVRFIAWGSLFLFIVACRQINQACFVLSLPAAVCIYAYSYAKRFTAASHFILGIIQFLGPVMAWAAVTGSYAWPPVWLGGGVFFLLSGSDIIYALQDYDFDKAHGLFSIPVAIGKGPALFVGKLLHGFALISFTIVGIAMDLSVVYYWGLTLSAGILFAAHRQIRGGDTSQIARLFPTCNTYVALSITLFAVGSILWDVLL